MFRREDVAGWPAPDAEEVLAVGRAEGARADLDDVMGLYQPVPADLGSSILFDREAGRALEWDARTASFSDGAARCTGSRPRSRTSWSLCWRRRAATEIITR